MGNESTKSSRANEVKTEPSQVELLNYLRYEASTGRLFWIRKPSRRVNVGATAGRIADDGYIVVGWNFEIYKAHRLIWMMVHGRSPLNQIDHRDGDRANNRLCNLREATPSQNVANKH